MAAGPVQPPSPEQPRRGRSDDRARTPASDGGASGRSSGERFGPLTIRRVGKDDGRSLILYDHAEAQPESAQAAPASDRGREHLERRAQAAPASDRGREQT